MPESLKDQRERVAGEVYRAAMRGESWKIDGMYRDLQRQAIEAIKAAVIVESGDSPEQSVFRHIDIDALLDGPAPVARIVASMPRTSNLAAGFVMQLPPDDDGPAPEPHRFQEPPPHHPPRCIRCGLHEGIGHPGNHLFQPQSPRCHRAHPHDEPCEPERQAAAESRGWDTVGGGDE